MEQLVSELVKALKANKPTPDQVDLPIFFHPEMDEAAKWLDQVEKVKNELSWSDVEVLGTSGSVCDSECT